MDNSGFQKATALQYEPPPKKKMISNTQTYLIETLCMQGSTLHLVNYCYYHHHHYHYHYHYTTTTPPPLLLLHYSSIPF